MKKIPLHIPEPLPGAPLAPWFLPPADDPFFARAGRSMFFHERVAYVDVASARALVLPNNFMALGAEARAYIARHADAAARRGIPVIVFSLGDLSDRLRFDPRALVIRLSVYRSAMRVQDVVMPTLTEDIGRGGIAPREKRAVPVVSFCGKADFGSARERAASWLRRAKYEALGLTRPARRARVRGVFWRRAGMRACERSALVKTNFIVRRTFSGARRTIELDPARARTEFIGSIRESDFVLAPKGDGNYSNRFLEALAMGRIPVVIDTDIALPLESEIDYSKIMVRVPMHRVHETPRYIRAFYDALSDEEWQARQRLARDAFERYLSVDAFFGRFFDGVSAP